MTFTLSPEWNIFSYKSRDVDAQGRFTTIEVDLRVFFVGEISQTEKHKHCILLFTWYVEKEERETIKSNNNKSLKCPTNHWLTEAS